MSNQEEIFIIVNKDDNIVDYKPRSITHKEGVLHRTVGVMVFNDKGEILLQKRSQHVDTYPGSYTISATGHVSKGETYEEAAQRELLEEIGISADQLKFEMKMVKDFPAHHELQSFYSTIHNGPFKFPKQDVEKVEFVAIDKLPEYFDKSTPTIKILYNGILKRN